MVKDQEIQKLDDKVSKLGDAVYQMKGTQAQQTEVLSRIGGTLVDLTAAIKEVSQISKAQVSQEKDIEHIQSRCERMTEDVEHHMRIISPDRVKNIEERLRRLDTRIEKNAETDNAQEARFSGLLQKLVFAGFGAFVPLLVLIFNWLKTSGGK